VHCCCWCCSDLERRHLQEKERARQEAAVKVRETKIAVAQLAGAAEQAVGFGAAFVNEFEKLQSQVAAVGNSSRWQQQVQQQMAAAATWRKFWAPGVLAAG
jgi:hypothetical protein